MTTIDRKKVEALQRREAKRFVEEHPQSAALYERARKGITLMPPTEDALYVGEDLKKRFGLPVLAIHVDGDGREPIFDPDCARDYPAGEDSWYFITAITARWTKHLRVAEWSCEAAVRKHRSACQSPRDDARG